MSWLFKLVELSALVLLILVAVRLGHGHAYGAARGVIKGETHHNFREALNLWATFIGVLLIAILCWVFASSVLGEGWRASCLALAVFFIIGLNLLDDEFSHPND